MVIKKTDADGGDDSVRYTEKIRGKTGCFTLFWQEDQTISSQHSKASVIQPSLHKVITKKQPFFLQCVSLFTQIRSLGCLHSEIKIFSFITVF